MTARYFNVPVLFAKKTQSVNVDGNKYCADVESMDAQTGEIKFREQ